MGKKKSLKENVSAFQKPLILHSSTLKNQKYLRWQWAIHDVIETRGHMGSLCTMLLIYQNQKRREKNNPSFLLLEFCATCGRIYKGLQPPSMHFVFCEHGKKKKIQTTLIRTCRNYTLLTWQILGFLDLHPWHTEPKHYQMIWDRSEESLPIFVLLK